MDMNTAFDLEVKHTARRRRWSTTCFTWWLAMAERWTGCEWEQANALKSDKPARKWSKCALVAARNRAKRW